MMNVDYLELSGYQPKAPSYQAAAIDSQVCAESQCDECGHKGLDYRPFTKPGSYRAFAVCPECGEAVEF